MMLLKLAAAPAAVWLASQAGRRFGHRVAGLLGGFPMIAGPIVLFIALDAGPVFAEALAWATVAAGPGVAVHCLVYAWLARLGLRWPVCLLAAWTACVAAAWVLTGFALKGLPAVALALGVGVLLAAVMPRPRGTGGIAPIPGFEIAVRMLSALVLAALIMFGAGHFGERVSGVLLGFPITASVLPVFTLAMHGPDATIRLLSGFVTGLIGFVVHFCVFAASVGTLGALGAFAAGVFACVASVTLLVRLQRRRPTAGRAR